jgi:hypothetical protein
VTRSLFSPFLHVDAFCLTPLPVSHYLSSLSACYNFIFHSLIYTMTGNTIGRTGTTTSSTDSGQGSEPLSDVFVAVAAENESIHNSSTRVEVPEGSTQLLVRRSKRVASSRSTSTLANASSSSLAEIVEAPPGVKHKLGYAYQILPPVVEEAEPSARPVVLAGNASSLRDAATPQMGPAAGTQAFTGRKRSATSASGRHGSVTKRLASAADFSPTHFDEPNSDAPIPPPPSILRPRLPSPHQQSTVPSPAQDITTPLSSPISQNPLRRDSPMMVQTPSPARRSPHTFRTRDSNAAWAAAEGLLPIREGFSAPGFAPSHLVGGMSYVVRSPKAPSPRTHRPAPQQTRVGRQLFAPHTSKGMQGCNPQPRAVTQAAANGTTKFPSAAADSISGFYTAAASSIVAGFTPAAAARCLFFYIHSNICAYIDSIIVSEPRTSIPAYAVWHASTHASISATYGASGHTWIRRRSLISIPQIVLTRI